MKIEFEVDERTLQAMAHEAVRAKLSPTTVQKTPILLNVAVEQAITKALADYDLPAVVRPAVKAKIDELVTEIVTAAVNAQIRNLARTITQQEIEKLKAATIEPSKPRE